MTDEINPFAAPTEEPRPPADERPVRCRMIWNRDPLGDGFLLYELPARNRCYGRFGAPPGSRGRGCFLVMQAVALCGAALCVLPGAVVVLVDMARQGWQGRLVACVAALLVALAVIAMARRKPDRPTREPNDARLYGDRDGREPIGVCRRLEDGSLHVSDADRLLGHVHRTGACWQVTAPDGNHWWLFRTDTPASGRRRARLRWRLETEAAAWEVRGEAGIADRTLAIVGGPTPPTLDRRLLASLLIAALLAEL